MSITHAPPARVHRPQLNVWLVAVIALAAALVALGAWVVVDQTRSSSTQGLASSQVVTMLKHRLVALNSGDAKAVSAFYTRDAVLEEHDVTPPLVTQGSTQIGARVHDIVSRYGMQLQSASPVIRLDGTVAEATSVPGYPDQGFILVYSLAPNGKIAHQWVLPASTP